MTPDPLIVWLDVETTGLDPDRCQVIEVGLVPTLNGMVRYDLAAECRVAHRHLTYEPDRLLGMGTGLDPRPGLASVPAGELDAWLFGTLTRYRRAAGSADQSLSPGFRVDAGGKNLGTFDLRFLGRLCPTAVGCIRHRVWDAGTLYARPGESRLPDLAECLRRAGLPDAVAHTALADAKACAELYAAWCRRPEGAVANG